MTPPEDLVRLKLVRFMVMGMILAMAWQVVPLMGAHLAAPAAAPCCICTLLYRVEPSWCRPPSPVSMCLP